MNQEHNLRSETQAIKKLKLKVTYFGYHGI